MIIQRGQKLKSSQTAGLAAAVAVCGLAYYVLCIVFQRNQKSVLQTISVSNCPKEVPEFDQYFCSGVDISNYSSASVENSQGHPDGYYITIGPLNEYNLNFSVTLLVQSSQDVNGQLRIDGNLQAASDPAGPFKDIEPIFVGSDTRLSANTSMPVQLVRQLRPAYKYYRLQILNAISYGGNIANSSLEIATYQTAYGVFQLTMKSVVLFSALISVGVAIVFLSRNKPEKSARSTMYMLMLIMPCIYVSPADVFVQSTQMEQLLLIQGGLKALAWAYLVFVAAYDVLGKISFPLVAATCAALQVFSGELVNALAVFQGVQQSICFIASLCCQAILGLAVCVVSGWCFVKAAQDQSRRVVKNLGIFHIVLCMYTIMLAIAEPLQVGQALVPINCLDVLAVLTFAGLIALWWPVESAEESHSTFADEEVKLIK